MKNRIILKKIRNILILIMAVGIIFGIYKFIDDSRAENLIEIPAIAIDEYGILNDEEFNLKAKEIDKDSLELLIPKDVNTKLIKNISKATIAQNEIDVTKEKVVKSKEEILNNPINFSVEYDIIAKNTQEKTEDTRNFSSLTKEEREKLIKSENYEILYNKILRYEDFKKGKMVELKGFFPKDAKISAKELSQTEMKKIYGTNKIDVAYDIKILLEKISETPVDEKDPNKVPEKIVENIEVDPESFGEVCEVSITDSKIDEKSKVYHIKDDKTCEKININSKDGKNIKFNAKSFSVYVVSPDIGLETGGADNTNPSPTMISIDNKSSWFKAGDYSIPPTVAYNPNKIIYIKPVSGTSTGNGAEYTDAEYEIYAGKVGDGPNWATGCLKRGYLRDPDGDHKIDNDYFAVTLGEIMASASAFTPEPNKVYTIRMYGMWGNKR